MGRCHPNDRQRGAFGSPPHVEPARGGEIAKLYTEVAPNYGALIESYTKAQEVAKQAKK